MVFQQKLAEKPYFFVKMSSVAVVWPASPDFWKAPRVWVKVAHGFPLMRQLTFVVVIITQLLLYSHFISNCLCYLLEI